MCHSHACSSHLEPLKTARKPSQPLRNYPAQCLSKLHNLSSFVDTACWVLLSAAERMYQVLSMPVETICRVLSITSAGICRQLQRKFVDSYRAKLHRLLPSVLYLMFTSNVFAAYSQPKTQFKPSLALSQCAPPVAHPPFLSMVQDIQPCHGTSHLLRVLH